MQSVVCDIRHPCFDQSYVLFLPVLAAVIATLLISLVVGGTGLAARVAWVCAMLAPAWLARSVGSLTIDLRFVTLFLLIPICLFGGSWIRGWTLIDALVVCLAVVGIVSLQRSESLSPSECLAIISIWIVPYLMGRLVIRDLSDLNRLLPLACYVCIFLSTWSIVESTTKVNPLNVLAGRGGSRISEQNYRMNLRRAEGPLGHPIYFGLSLAMMFPWAVEGARRAWNNQLPKPLLLTPLVCAGGVFCTVSRGPMLVLIVSAGSALFFGQPAWRMPLGIMAVLAIVLMVTAWPLVVDQLETVSGENFGATVTIGGEEYEYSGTKHRTLLYVAYSQALQDAGWFGHGKWGSKHEHMLYLEPHLRRTFRSIDNHYILLVLNWGVVGLAAFLAFGITAIGAGVRLAFAINPQHRVLLGSMSATVAAVMLLLLTVWFSSGFGFSWLCYLGMLSSAVLADRQANRSPVIESATSVLAQSGSSLTRPSTLSPS